MSNTLPKREIVFDLDKGDTLPPKGAFILPSQGSGQTYFCGHSLGPICATSQVYLEHEIQRWAKLGVAGYFGGEDAWLHYLDPLHLMMSRIVGAQQNEVVIMNSLTTNIHLMLAGFYRPMGSKNKIVMERPAFGSDVYAVTSHAKVRGVEHAIIDWEVNGDTGLFELADFEDLLNKHHQDISLIFLGGLNYLSGELLDIKGLTEVAHSYDIRIGFDLAHAVGNVDLHLHDWGVDFAVWCTYKYLCGGPGSVGACFIHERLSSEETHFKGWWGNRIDNRFEMSPEFKPSDHAAGWQLSNPPLLALPYLKASLETFDHIGFSKISAKSQLLSTFVMELLKDWTEGEIVTPTSPERHGAMISIKCGTKSNLLHQALQDAGFVVDYRSPDIIRLSTHGLYNTFDDCYRFASTLKSVSGSLSI